ncbi:hypothetical protein [Mycobacterium basiliense]
MNHKHKNAFGHNVDVSGGVRPRPSKLAPVTIPAAHGPAQVNK